MARLSANESLPARRLEGVDYDIQEMTFHPDYDTEDPATYDSLALVRLKTVVRFTPFIRPACLLPQHVFPETPVMVVGRVGVMAQKQNTSVISKKECASYVQNVQGKEDFKKGIPDSALMCVKAAKNLVKYGGLPLQLRLPEPYCMYGLVGASLYISEAEARTTDLVVYLRISHYLPWIEKTVWPERAQFVYFPPSLIPAG